MAAGDSGKRAKGDKRKGEGRETVGFPSAYLFSALGLLAVAIGGFVYTLAVGNQPLLGLDLQGGVSVVYQPTEPADDEALDQTLEIIRNRVDGLGVAEPEISRQGETIVVDLPGVEQQQRALDLVGETAELRFRPVHLDPATMASFGFGLEGLDLESTGDGSGDDGNEFDVEIDPDAVSDGEEGTDEESMGPIRRRQTDDETDETSDETGEDTTPPALSAVEQAVVDACLTTGEATPTELDTADAYVLLPSQEGGFYCLGPSLLTGETLEGADALVDGFGRWTVNPVFRPGEDGIDQFNRAAAICAEPFAPGNSDICPATGTDSQTGLQRGALAIVLDHEVVSAPLINASSFDRNNIVISGSFDEDSARDLALALRFGALPVELEAQQTRTVSATIGDDVLRAGVIAGIVGLVLVGLYLFAYYRLAGLVAIAGLAMSGLMLWTIISYLGDRYGLAISLAGIVGLIVSIGVSADSNIVYFENAKDIAAHGRRVTTAVERAYRTSISTILKADVVSLIAATLLYFLTVGAVKGFALYLGIATVLDLLVAYLFMRPALAWLATRSKVRANPRLLGMPEGGA